MNEHRFVNDSVARALSVLGDYWTFLVLREAFFGVRRFNEMAENLKLSRNILSDRLRKLVAHGVLERRRYQEKPDRYEYRLTARGNDLYGHIVALMRWGDEHLAGPEGPPLILHHRPCDHDAIPLVVCSHCGQELQPEDVIARPGPGAHAAESQASVPSRWCKAGAYISTC